MKTRHQVKWRNLDTGEIFTIRKSFIAENGLDAQKQAEEMLIRDGIPKEFIEILAIYL